MTLEIFKDQCISLKPDILVQKHLIEDITFFFDKIRKGEEFDFKKDIASILNVHVRDIVIVGSGKFGFSLKPSNASEGLYLFKEFDYNYKNKISEKKSDLDIAIVSSYLFDKEIQYTCGMCTKNNVFIVSSGFKDEEAYLVKIPFTYLNNNIFNLSTYI